MKRMGMGIVVGLITVSFSLGTVPEAALLALAEPMPASTAGLLLTQVEEETERVEDEAGNERERAEEQAEREGSRVEKRVERERKRAERKAERETKRIERKAERKKKKIERNAEKEQRKAERKAKKKKRKAERELRKRELDRADDIAGEHGERDQTQVEEEQGRE